jgi:hypothetical protein
VTSDLTPDLERLASAIRGLEDLRLDLRAEYGIGRDEQLRGTDLRGLRDRQISAVVADIRVVHGHLIVEEAHRWAQPKPAGTVELVLPEDNTLSGP